MFYSLNDESGMSTLVGADSLTRQYAVRAGLDYICVSSLNGKDRMEARQVLSTGTAAEQEQLLEAYGWTVEEHEQRQHEDGRESDEELDTEEATSVALPNPFSDSIKTDEWVNVDNFTTRREAIEWAMENLGADEFGRIIVVRAGEKPTSETEV